MDTRRITALRKTHGSFDKSSTRARASSPLPLTAALLSATLLLTAGASAAEHGVLAGCVLTGPTGWSYAHPGERVQATFEILNICEFLHPVTVTSVRLTVQRASGVVTYNLISSPITLQAFWPSTILSTNFTPQVGETGKLPATWMVEYADSSLQGVQGGGADLTILPPPKVSIQRASDNTIRISWPATVSSALVQSSADVGHSWTYVRQAPTRSLDGREWSITVNSTGAQFFRLVPDEALVTPPTDSEGHQPKARVGGASRGI